MSPRRYRLACLVTHPIQYQAPLFRYLAADPAIDLEVLFLSRRSAGRFLDSGFGVELKWDTPLLDGYAHKFLPSYGADDALSFWRPFTRELAASLREGRYEALWLHGYAHQVMLRAITLACPRGVKLLLRGDSHLRGGAAGPARRALKRLILPRLFRRIDGFLAVGTLNARFYRHYGVSRRRIFPMPYAVDNGFFRAAARVARPAGERLRASIGIAPLSPVILFAGKLQRIKRPGDLLDALARLPVRKSGADPYLLFAGDGELRGELEQRAAAQGLARVKFLGFRNQSELPALFELCDVMVLPSEREQWGLVLNEVMNAAKPVIVSDRVGAAADLVAHGHNGFIYPCGEVDRLSGYLGRLLQDRALAARMGAASLRRIEQWNFEADRRGLLQALGTLLPGVPAQDGYPETVPARSRQGAGSELGERRLPL